jgi:ATP-dependent DNA helicase RecG
MTEHQHLEWKESWRDDHLRWVCGFANAEGGTLVIGRNDQGEVVGIADARKLLEDLPNKTRNLLGILVEVNLRQEGGKNYLELVTPPYPSPISYRGHYYQRSGSTLQELKGAALDRFLLRRQGRTWDGVPVPHVAVDDLSVAAIDAFRKQAGSSQRMEAGVLREPAAGLIDKLHLLDGTYLKRAAVLLFHADPERFVTGAFVKIGYFRSESDLVYHDEIHGDLFSQVRRTMELLLSKYMKAAISYRGIQRVESFPVPEAALREAVLNALIHRDYAVGAPVQIRVHGNRLRIWNPGHLPEHWTVEKLLKPHASKPFNPDIANSFFRAGEIEAWGRGIQRIFEVCQEHGVPPPLIDYAPGDLWIEFPYSRDYLAVIPAEDAPESSVKTAVKTAVKSSVKTPTALLALLRQNPQMTLAEVAIELGRSVRAVEMASAKLVKSGKLRYVGPQKGGHWEVID